MASYGHEYREARPDIHVDKARWDRICKWWLDVKETGEWTNISEFSRSFGVSPGQLCDEFKKYQKRIKRYV